MNQSRPLRIVLDNGLTVLLQRQNRASTSFGLGVRFGSAHHGAAHFIEHLPFKGTDTRTYKQINRQAVRGGGDFDAFTDFFSTFFITKNLSPYAHDIFELLCDMINNPTFPEEEVEYERGVVLEEIEERSGEPEQILMDRIYRNLFCGHPLERAVIDSKEIIRTISRENLLDIYRTYYTPENIVIIGVGPIDKQVVLETIKKYFPSAPTNAPQQSHIPSLPLSTPLGRIIIPQPFKRIHLMVGFRAVPRTHPDFYPLRVLSAIMGENIDSRLYERAREKRGLVYHITSHFDTIRSSWQSILKADCTSRHGVLRIYTNFSPKNLSRVEKTIKKELQTLAQQEVSEEELEANKQKLIGKHQLDTLGTFRYMRLLFAAEINNSLKDFPCFEEKISAVTAKDVLRVAHQYCDPNKGMWAILQPQR